ncbi:hypothetical protein GCM10027062_12330 [Nocardioides hungaricus]
MITSDEFLCALLTDHRHGVVESFTRAALSKKSPPTTTDDLATRLAIAGAPRFAGRVRPHLAH